MVWGASPQALRLQYQARKRAKATQKLEQEQMAAEQSELNIDVPMTEELVVDANIRTPPVNTDNHLSDANPAKPRSKSLNDLRPPNPVIVVTEETELNSKKEPYENPPPPQRVASLDEESKDHLYPSEVDTSEVVGRVVQVNLK